MPRLHVDLHDVALFQVLRERFEVLVDPVEPVAVVAVVPGQVVLAVVLEYQGAPLPVVEFTPNQATIDDFLEVTNDGTDTTIKVNADGDGSGYSDLTIELARLTLTNTDLGDLMSDGNLIIS